MPGLKCKCGNIIKLGEIPNPNEWLLISDIEYDKYSGLIDSEDLYHTMNSMIKCNKCKRIWIYWDGYEKDPVCYTLDHSH